MNMRRIFSPLGGTIILAFLFYSCTSITGDKGLLKTVPSEVPGMEPRSESPGEKAAAEEGLPEIPEDSIEQAIVPETPEEPIEQALIPETPEELPLAAPPETPDNPLLDASLPEEIAALPPEIHPDKEGQLPIRPEFPPTPERILGMGRIPFYGLALFLLDANPGIDAGYIEDLALYYTEEAAQEGVNHDIAFAQMCLETGFLRYGGLVTPEMNNFCGLGSIGPGRPGEQFPSPRMGIRAHIQHLKAYATEAPLRQDLVDPRYRYVRYGSAPTLDGLTGSWAVDREYSQKIRYILERLYAFAFIPPEKDVLAKTDGESITP
jgi:hypothetical protein